MSDVQRGDDTSLGQRERSDAFASPPGGIPRKVVVIALICFAVLGLGGAGLDRVFTGPSGSSSPETVPGAYPPPLRTGTTAPAGGSRTASQLAASLPALMALTPASGAPAPGFTLVGQNGQTVSLAAYRGKVVVLTFFDAACDDVCPVLAAELGRAYADLGADASDVAFLTINTDPLSSNFTGAGSAGLSSVGSWRFLSGSLRQLNTVWTAYGIGVDVQRGTATISHNDLMYFIDRNGLLRLRATPFANESATGQFSLPESTEGAWATGIADQARSLLGGRG